MFAVLLDVRRSVLIAAGLVLLAVGGWGSFAYSAVSSRHQMRAVAAERDAAVAEARDLQKVAGDLTQAEAKLAAARLDHARTTQGLTDLRTRIAAAQQELAGLNKRVERGGDKVTHTGSIRQPEPPKRSGR